MTRILISISVGNEIVHTDGEILGVGWEFYNPTNAAPGRHIFVLIRTLATNRDSVGIKSDYAIDLNNPRQKDVGCFLKLTAHDRGASETSSRRGMARLVSYKRELIDRKHLVLRR